MNALFFICGYEEIRCEAYCVTELLNFCMREQLTYRNFCTMPDGSVLLTVTAYSSKKIRKYAQSNGILIRSVGRGGLPFLLRAYRRRAGLFVGCMLVLFLFSMSGRYVWDVRISGNESMTREEVLAELEACGLGIGSYIPSVDTSVLENRVLLASDKISWIAVRMDGTVAVVQLLERVTSQTDSDSSQPANLIAASDGYIESLEIFRGNCLVTVGQSVRKGDLLVSGLYDSNTVGYRYTRAAGQVLARTERTVTVEIPLEYEEKYNEPEKCRQIDLNFFGFSVKIYKSTGNLPINCDIIKRNKALDIFGLSAIPVGWTVTLSSEFQTEQKTRTHEEALPIAYEKLEQELAAFSSDVQLLQKEIKTELTDNSVRLVCVLTCLENIAIQAEFDITD